MMGLENKVYQSAIRMLARREYSERELTRKLDQKFSAAKTDITPGVVRRLCEEGLLSDTRFAEMLVRSRVSRGYGPAYIQQELASKGISQQLIEIHLEELSVDWLHNAEDLVQRRHPNSSESQQAWQKAARYLQRRGFSADIVRRALGAVPY